jgi:hypothetical protein
MYRGGKNGFVNRRAAGRRSAGPGQAALNSLQEWAADAADMANVSVGAALAYGLARLTEGRVTSESIVFGSSMFEAAPFAKSYAACAPLVLALKPRFSVPEIRVLLDRGDRIDAETLTPRADGSFLSALVLPAQPGRYFVEIQGPGPLRVTLAWFPIYVGMNEPDAPDDFIQHPPAAPGDLGAWPGWLASLYDAERAKLGRSPLQVTAALGALAVQRALTWAAGQRPARVDTEAVLDALRPLHLANASLAERSFAVESPDGPLFGLLMPSTRERYVMPERVLFGASATALPVKPGELHTYGVIEHTVQVTAP